MEQRLTEEVRDVASHINQRKRIGQELKYRRLELGKTQTEVAEVAGYQQNTIHRIESGKLSAGFDILQKIAEALGCDIGLVKR